ncbi:GSCOCT00014169001.2-RA-CDS, partial [Cotesia congregata]
VSLTLIGLHICGGSIIGYKYVLTAAHCFVNLTHPGKKIQLDILGVRSHTIDSQYGGQLHGVERLWIHRYYNSFDPASLHDVAILKLKRPVQFDAEQTWIALQQYPIGSGHSVLSVGWGYTEDHPRLTSRKLKKVSLNTMEASVCENYLRDRVWMGRICTVAPRGQGLCNGDSGGPLITRDGKLVGLVSWGILCALGNPDVFTQVPLYYE